MKAVYNDLKLEVDKGVYKPAEDTLLLADNLEVKRGEDVLEIGTGCGLISIIATEKGGKVTSTDINEKSIKCAERNAENLGFREIDFRSGNLFEPINEKRFDLIIFNPPYLPVPESEKSSSAIDKAWNGGPDGREILDRFLDEVEKYLKPEGRFAFVQSSLTGLKETLEKIDEEKFVVERKTKKFSFEKLYLFKIKLKETSNQEGT